MVVGGEYVTLVLIPTEISVFGHDIVLIMGWGYLVSVGIFNDLSHFVVACSQF